MNALDFAAATLGNHEFNYGLDILERAYAARNSRSSAATYRRVDGELWFPLGRPRMLPFADEAGEPRD